MRKLLLLLLLGPMAAMAQRTTTVFETSKGARTPTYNEIVTWWKKLDATSPKVSMKAMGVTDAGFPLHLIVVSNNNISNLETARRQNKRIILINNGIHPGEPDGIDASMLLVRDIAEGRQQLPDNIVLAIIPVYNIGGCLNRSANYRVDQDGPEEFGFRGNSQNLDLNRDFIKCDSRDARAFTEIFHLADPDVFVDNHVSNGADYQHVMTLLTSQHNKLGGKMGEFMNREFEPGLYADMKQRGYDLIPYVNVWGDTPDKGWQEFWDSPRYGSGYASLWQTFAFVPETHMLKPYHQRVDATLKLMQSFIRFTSQHSERIKKLRAEAKLETSRAAFFPTAWEHNKTVSQDFLFKGFESGYKPSEVSGQPRLFYDRSKPYEKMVPIFNQYRPARQMPVPVAYVIPQGWWKVIELLKLNRIQMRQLTRDTSFDVSVQRIESYRSSPQPYEMHHPNTNVVTSSRTERQRFHKGDWFIPMNQRGNRFLMEVLEPMAEDSYFRWNFFDGILGQKEGYSAYAFEDIAADYLKTNPVLRDSLQRRAASDTAFARSARLQLDYVYRNSPWFEPAYLRYPIVSIAPAWVKKEE